MAKSYYAILGISSGADAEEIKAAYRRLVKEFHPDHYAGGSDIFQQIQEAYSVLSDHQERHNYDRTLMSAKIRISAGRGGRPAPEPIIPGRRSENLGDISLVRSFETFTPSLNEIFDWLWSNFSGLSRPKSGRVQELTIEVTLTREQALHGGNARVMIPVRAECPTCRGYGSVGPYECSRCAGEGAITGEMPISVAFPSGLTHDHAVAIPLERFGISNIYLAILFRPTG